MDDAAIVELFLARDQSAIEHTARKYGGGLRAVADRILCDSGTAEECENDTYLEAWDSIPPAEPRTYLFPFLCRIIRHYAIDRCRRRNAAKRSASFCELTAELAEIIASGSDVEGEYDASELGSAVSRYLENECTEAQRAVFVRRYYFFESVSEIASRFGRTPGSVKTMLSRTRAGLRAYLIREGYYI